MVMSGFELFWGLFNNLALLSFSSQDTGSYSKNYQISILFLKQVVYGFFFGLFSIACMHCKNPCELPVLS